MPGEVTVAPSATVCCMPHMVAPSMTKLTTYVTGPSGITSVSGVSEGTGVSSPVCVGAGVGVSALSGACVLSGTGSVALAVASGAFVSAGAAVSSASVLVGSRASTIRTQSVRLMIRLICDHFMLVAS